MANTKSAAKAARQALKRKAINTARSSRIKSSVKAAEAAVDGSDKAAAAAALKAMQTELSRGVKHGLLHRNAAARKMSRLSKRAKAIKS
ncbi:MAG: 30S ribosomal protein S20 [Alphaproteobacteria bacterium]|nr:30S ribosomal protein S20 [Alphaproteobacteria bacterium]